MDQGSSLRSASTSVTSLKNFPGDSDSKASAYSVGDRVQSLGREDPPEKEMATHSRSLAGKSQGRRSLVGYSP